MHTPVIPRSKSAVADDGSTTSSPVLASAPTKADSANSRRGSPRSGSPSTALATQPTTNPSWTALVSAACVNAVRWNSTVSAGSTAEAENHSDIAATWRAAITVIENAFDRAGTPGNITLRSIRQGSGIAHSAPPRAEWSPLPHPIAKPAHGTQPVTPAHGSGDQLHEPVLRTGEVHPRSGAGVARDDERKGHRGGGPRSVDPRDRETRRRGRPADLHRREPHVPGADRPRGHPAPR